MFALRLPRRCLRYCTSVVLTLLGVFVIYVLIRLNWYHRYGIDTTDWQENNAAFNPGQNNTAACGYLPEMENILVVLKTGATEALKKVPVHLETTLRCIQHYAVISDYEEHILGVQTRDVLRSVSQATRQTNTDFDIYNRLLTSGREGLTAEDWMDDENGPLGKPGNPGWKLDKWKFVPMISEALSIKQDAHWYIFLEADTYIIWRNMVRWLSRMDHKKPQYLGAPMQMGSAIFAYGGAGLVLSNPAMQLVAKYHAENFMAVENMTADDWAGDHVLGRILIDTGVPLIWSWPLLVSSSVWEFEPFTKVFGREPWCYPAVSFHHMSPTDIQVLWLFEQQWSRPQKKDSVILHKDIFKWQVYDASRSRKDNWDNLSPDLQSHDDTDILMSIDECERRCFMIAGCLQFSFSGEGCFISKRVIGGLYRPGVRSGWIQKRVKALMKRAGKCTKTQFITG
ncbi:uncharacterized protein BDV14DRAFT_203362 [Aspergillus stella-maris]|uniref:uncharacterized protein n=1 Tax=Aspergillus stella-maris TaxID=1810926 RepID=UPI003CCC9B30